MLAKAKKDLASHHKGFKFRQLPQEKKHEMTFRIYEEKFCIQQSMTKLETMAVLISLADEREGTQTSVS
jgi:hypothetical protein